MSNGGTSWNVQESSHDSMHSKKSQISLSSNFNSAAEVFESED